MRPPRRMAGPWTAAAGTSGIPDSGGVAHGPGRRPLVRGGVMHAPPRRRGTDGLRGEAISRPKTRGPRSVIKPAGALAVPLQAVCGGARRQAGTNTCRVRAMRRISPSCGQARSCLVSHVGMAGLEPAASRPPAARAANCATFRNRRHPPPEPKPRWAKKEDGGVARRPGLEPGSTVLETAVLAIAPPTQREASMTPRAWPPGPPEGRRRGRFPRAPSRIRTGDLPLTRRLRYHWAIGALTVPPIAFSNA